MADTWKNIIGVVLLAVTCYACDDMDTAVCQRLIAAKPDMCNDTCYSAICKRFCGKCPLKCYSCTDIESSQKCNATIECQGKDYQCISAASFTNDFREVYKLGCAPSTVCSHYGRRSINKRAGTSCCNTDLCNHGSGNKRNTKPKTTETVKRQVTSPACDDTDSLACTLLFTINTHMCADDCIANTICPRLCGKCSKCYDCDHVLTTERCNHSRICKPGEVCYTLETLNFDLEHGYRMGCVHQQVCDSMSSQVSNVFGRRSDSVEVSMSGGCCHGDLCNHHKLTGGVMSTNPPPTTTAKMCSMTAGCPFNPAARLDGQCYSIGNRPLSWSNAKAFCESHCSHLAVFQDLNQLRLTMEVLHLSDAISNLPAVHNHILPDMYVDAVNPTRSNHFLWSTTNQTVSPTLFGGSTPHHPCAFVHHSRHSIHSAWQLEGTVCSQMYYPLCQRRLE
ncbi:uncharacterized protein [Magallana gigas]|uniref:uncharacterized protein n=1 Tax=Magallana gigas TaxID=29159 RepID=UPI0033406EBD